MIWREAGFVCPKFTPSEARFVANLLAVHDRPLPAGSVPFGVDAVGMCRSLRMQAQVADRELLEADARARDLELAEDQYVREQAG